MSTAEPIVFYAALPTIRSAFIIAGEDPPSAQLKLDIPASEADSFAKIMNLGGKVLIVTIHLADGGVSIDRD